MKITDGIGIMYLAHYTTSIQKFLDDFVNNFCSDHQFGKRLFFGFTGKMIEIIEDFEYDILRMEKKGVNS